ncbi:MAG: cation:proton antiporter regulatory subunit, partial [Treponema sp.]
MQLSENFAIAEVKVRKEIEGKTLAESSLRQKYSLNVIGLRLEDSDEIKTASDPHLVLNDQMILLVAGTPQSIRNYTDRHATSEKQKKDGNVFRKLLHRNNSKK